MELLIAFLVGLGIFNTTEEAYTYTSNDLEEIRIDNHYDLINQYDEEYTSIYGIDETEIY